MTRRDERKELLAVLFETCFKEDSVEEIFADATLSRDFVPTEYIDTMLKGILEKSDILDQNIKENLVGWKFERISKIAICIMRISIYEMMFCDHEEIPESASINEAVELAKIFGSDDDPAFINGVLSSVYKTLHKAE